MRTYIYIVYVGEKMPAEVVVNDDDDEDQRHTFFVVRPSEVRSYRVGPLKRYSNIHNRH